MKKIGLLLIILQSILFSATAQAPQSFKYQAIARNLQGNAITGKNISVRISILSGGVDGMLAYSETHHVTTNQFGLFALEIGNGKNNIGNFSDIAWGSNEHFVKIEIDETGGQDFKLMGVSQLLSVPYALYAEKSGSSSKEANSWTEGTGVTYLTNPNDVGIGTTLPDSKLHVIGTGINSVFERNISTTAGPVNRFYKSRGSASSKTQIQAGDNMGQFQWWGMGDDGSYDIGATFKGVAESTRTGTDIFDVAASIQFLTTNTSFNWGERMRITADGYVGIGTTAPASILDIAGQYHFPNVDGSSGQVLRTDGSSNLTWQNAGASQIDDLSDGRTGGGSVFLGAGAGNSDDLNNNKNVALGIDALNTNTSGNNNTAIGNSALYNNTIGNKNTSNGTEALYYNTSGNLNTAIGYHTLYSNTSGTNNTALGERALFYNKTGLHNTALGSTAALFNYSGSYNTAVGREAIFFNKNGSRNTVIGYQAGMGVVNNSVSGNIFIGYQAGINETSDNKLYIENSNSSTPLIYGEFDNDKLAVNGSLGIGIMNPGKVLHVEANNDSLQIDNLAGTGPLLSIDANGKVFRSTTSLLGLDTSFDYWIDSLYIRNTDTIMTITDNGNVGIGTVNPSQMLELGFGGNIKMNYVDPPGAVTVTLNPAAGNINGTNSYIATFVTERGETEMGAYGGHVSGAVNQQVDISNIPIGPKDVIARNIYRSSAGSGYSFKLVKTINDNTTTTFTDNVPDASLGKVASASNTTGGRIYLNNSILIESGAYKVVIGRDAGNLDNPIGSDGAQGIFIGPYAGKVNSGTANVFIGYAAAENTTTGSMNTFIGQRAGNANTTGVSNTYLGIQTGSKNVNGNDNLAVGAFAAVESTSGNSNVYLGAAAGRFKTGGSNNTMVGKYAGYQGGDGSGNVFLGHRAGHSETGSNFLYIDNSSTSSPLIWGDFANNRVNINGRLGVGTTNPSEELEIIGSIRMADGSQANGKIMMSDANGTASWADPTTVGQWHVTPHSINPNNISPVNSNIHMFSITGNTANELTLGQLTDLNDVSNYSGAVFEVKGSGPDYTNNMSFGKYSDNYYVPSWAGNGVISTDQDMALASVGSNDPTNPNPDPHIFFQIGGGYTSPIDIMDLNSNGLAFTSGGVRINEFLDEDDLASDSDTKLATQQSIKAYVDNAFNGTVKEINDLSDGKTGGSSVFLGAGAGFNDNGINTQNVAIGIDALNTNTSGYQNTASGYRALFSNTTGHWNNANGAKALENNTEGSQNVANGYMALNKNITGNRNVANGLQALYNNTTGSNNTANGHQALSKNLTGINNTANGYQSLYLNTQGNYNTANGYYALVHNTNGSGNTANGSISLYANTTGNWNTANGYNALRSNTEGRSNSASGYQCLFSNTTGNGNTANGFAANYYNQAGSYNTIIGYEAGQGDTIHSKSGNIFLGYRAGYYDTTDNKLYIENSNSTTPLIWGDFDLNLLNINGNLGIGTNSPDYRLQVNGDAVPETDLSFDIGKPALRWNNIYAGTVHAANVTGGEWTDHQNGFIYAKQAALNGDTVVITDNGQVGIGISNPAGALHVASGNFGLQLGNSLTGLPIPGAAFYHRNGLESYYNGIVDATAAGGPFTALIAYIDSTRNHTSTIGMDHNEVFVYMDDAYFHRGMRIESSALYVNYNNNRIGQQGIVKIDTNSHVLLQQIYRGDTTISSDDYTVQLVTDFNHGIFAKGKDQLSTNSALNVVDSSWHTLFRVMNNGYVGVGTYTPHGILDIAGAYHFPAVDGTNRQFLRTDGAGNLSWSDGEADYIDDLLDAVADTINVFLGYNAGGNDDGTFNYNTGTGVYALHNNTSGDFNSAFGAGSLFENTTGNNNTSNGMASMFYNISGSYNTASGAFSLYNNNDGNNNSGFGYNVLNTNTSGSSNTALGSNAMKNNTVGSNNVAVGHQALNSNTVGVNNVAMGFQAMYSNISGADNTSSGTNALYSNASGFGNTATGSHSLYTNTTGGENTATGNQAMLLNTTGYQNAAHGAQALYSNIDGANNTANGYKALYANTSGHNNTANGWMSLNANTSGTLNTATGAEALYSNTTAADNTATGYRALRNTTTGSGNTAHGSKAMNNNTTGYFNTANGFQALFSSTTGETNVAIGGYAMYNNTKGSGNTAVGYQALYSNDTAIGNVAVGRFSMYSNTFGSNNTAVGTLSLYSNTTGAGNVANGLWSLYSNTTGDFNTASGFSALYSNTEGDFNTAIGHICMENNTTGIHNTAMGAGALNENTTGNSNCAFGNGALRDNTIANNNNAFGTGALRFNSTGASNTAMGHCAGNHNTTGTNNAIFGTGANQSNEEGSYNTIIGSQAGGGGTALHNKSGNVFIGYMAGFDIMASNRLYIENSNSHSPLLYGEFDNDIVGINGQLGVGTIAPSHTLDVNGNMILSGSDRTLFAENSFNISASSGIDMIIDNDNNSTNSEFKIKRNGDGSEVLFLVEENGNVGIGTTNPAGTFHAKNGNYGLWLSDALAGMYPGAVNYYIKNNYAFYTGVVERDPGVGDLSAIMGFHDFARDMDNNIEIDSNEIRINYNKTTARGRINIDSTRMELYLRNESDSVRGTISIDNNSNIMLQQTYDGNQYPYTGVQLTTSFLNGVEISGWGSAFLNSVFKVKNQNGIEALTILQNGNVGINNPTPNQAMDVNGTVNANSYMVNGTAGFNGTIPVYNTGVSGQTSGITVVNGIITGYNTIP